MTAAASHSRRRVSPLWIIAAVLGGVVFVVSMILWIAGFRDEKGTPVIENPGALLVAVISGLFSLAAVVIPILLSIRTSTAKTEEHVVNSHGATILRDDIDWLKVGVKSLIENQRQQGQDILGLREELGSLRQTDREQWKAIEDTAGLRRKGDSPS